jgi:hypothetical protein
MTDEEIISYFCGKRRMRIHKKISPTNVPGGGYWLNDVEVDVKQLVAVYRKYSGNETITMSD